MYLIALLKQYLIIFAQCDTEDNRCDVLEAMNPLLSFASLTANVKHAARCCVSTVPGSRDAQSDGLLYAQLTHCKSCLVYTRRLRSRS